MPLHFTSPPDRTPAFGPKLIVTKTPNARAVATITTTALVIFVLALF
jgi:hypothetical protein